MPDVPYDMLQAFKTIVIEYSGSGDEGHINDIRPEPEVEGLEFRSDLYEDLERFADDVLEANYPGWEINEGSEGTITIHVPERKVILHHGERVESTNWFPEQEV